MRTRRPKTRSTSAEAPVSANIFDDAMLELEQQIDAVVESSDAPITNPRATRQAAAVLESLTGAMEDEPSTGTDYYFRQWGRVALRNRSERVDDFGLDKAYEAKVSPAVAALTTRYFRQSIEGVENIPASGRVLLVCNRGGLMPLDGLLLRFGLKAAQGRETRWLVEDTFFHMPFVGSFLTRVGAVRACQPNAERLLKSDACVAVFPEGMQGVRKRYRQRYQLQRFGRGGYVRLALRTGATVVPVGIVGPEDAYPLIFRERRLARLLRLPFLPITPTFPALGPLGVLPLPSRFRIVIGAPIELDEHRGSSEDELLISRLNDSIRAKVGVLVQRALETRGNAYRS